MHALSRTRRAAAVDPVRFTALIPRLNEVIRSTAGVRLDHFLDDGDSPDIPIPIYVGHLERIREMALEVHP